MFCPQSCESPLQIPSHLVELLAMTMLIPNSANSSVSGLFCTTYSCWRWGYEQIWNLYANGAVNFYKIIISLDSTFNN
jgi:hypothetical protein